MAMSKCRECGKAVSTHAKTCPHCGVPKPTKKTKKVKKKTIASKSSKVMDLMCANSNCTAWLHPANVPYSRDISFYKCPRCDGSMKKYSAKVAEDDKRRVKGMAQAMYKKLHEENAAEVARLRKSSQSKSYNPSSTSTTSSSTSTNYNKSSGNAPIPAFTKNLYETGDTQPDLSEVLVVPNPYLGTAKWEARYEDRLMFKNLPALCKISIFSLSGDLVDEIDHIDGSDIEYWDLISRNKQSVVSGLYIYVVENGKDKHVGKFSIFR